METTDQYQDDQYEENNQNQQEYENDNNDHQQEGLQFMEDEENYEEGNELEINEDRELIYNEDSGYHNVDKLFDEQSGESAFYEIQFRIFDKKQNKVNKLI
jgi:hypothetical protein